MKTNFGKRKEKKSVSLFAKEEKGKKWNAKISFLQLCKGKKKERYKYPCHPYCSTLLKYLFCCLWEKSNEKFETCSMKNQVYFLG